LQDRQRPLNRGKKQASNQQFILHIVKSKSRDNADKRFSANSKDTLVLVLFSKKRLAMVISLNEGTFFMDLLITSLK
jgi:hypothetical protein